MASRTIAATTWILAACAGCGEGSAVPHAPDRPVVAEEKDLPPVPTLSPDAPQDKPVDLVAKDGDGGGLEAALAPYIERARKSYPEARARYLAGLPAGSHFFVVTRLQGPTGTFEQVFISVAEIEDGKITGRIASQLQAVQGFKQNEPYTFPESDLIDWLITRPDGSEEGNVVGKYIDSLQQAPGPK